MILALFAAAQAAPPPSLPTYPVAEVAKHLIEWDGRTIRVRGFMIDCGVGHWSCAIAPRRGDAKDALRIGGDTVGVDHGFDALAGAEVVLRARVEADCAKPDHVCTDRASVLEIAAVEQVIQKGRR